MGLIRTVGPVVEPLSIDEVQKHLRLDDLNVEPVPSALTAALASTPIAGNVDNGAHRYRCTFVTADGETSGGDISSAVTVADKSVNGKVALTAIPIGGAFVTARKIYRTAAAGSTYLLLTTLADNTTTTYTDNVADASLGAGVPTANTTGDPELRRLILTAREAVESYTKRSLITQTWKQTLECFPPGDVILLARPNLLTVSTFKYLDGDNVEQTVDAAVYTADPDFLPGRILKNWNQLWPLTYPDRNAVRIVYTAGYGATAASVPEPIKHAMKLLITDLYEQRETTIIGTIVAELPYMARLLGQYCYEELR